MDLILVDILTKINNALGSWIIVMMIPVSFAIILYLWKKFGADGLYAYNIIAVICANIQALKIAPFFGISNTLALSTVIFATTFIVTDIITENLGTQAASKGLKLSFVGQFLFSFFMISATMYPGSIGYIDGMNLAKEDVMDPVQYSMYQLFIPSLRILVSSLIAYYLSQVFDIYIFAQIKKRTSGKFLWLRFNVSTIISSIVDNTVFSTLAWVLLAPNPISTEELINTYILGSYFFRFLVNISATFLIYCTLIKKE